MRSIRQFALALLPLPAFLAVAPPTGSDIHEDVVKTIAEFKKKDSGMEKFFASAAGYAAERAAQASCWWGARRSARSRSRR